MLKAFCLSCRSVASASQAVNCLSNLVTRYRNYPLPKVTPARNEFRGGNLLNTRCKYGMVCENIRALNSRSISLARDFTHLVNAIASSGDRRLIMDFIRNIANIRLDITMRAVNYLSRRLRKGEEGDFN